MTNSEMNRYVAEKLGVRWHKVIPSRELRLKQPCICGSYDCNPADNPDFTTDSSKGELLRLMMKREDCPDFVETIGYISAGGYGRNQVSFIRLDYITDTTGKLLTDVYEWLKETQMKCLHTGK